MYGLVKRGLFLLSAEKAHTVANKIFDWCVNMPGLSQIIHVIFSYEHKSLERNICGLKFKNPVGLAAGFDKNGEHIKSMSALGFGFIEVGTVTPRPQSGNPKPRLFRLINDHAIINRMGFNNDGVDVLINNLKKVKNRRNLIIGGNIGKNKDTPNDQAYEDYLICFKKLYDHVDYFVVNISSPNTPGLRELQDKTPLTKILTVLLMERNERKVKRPVFLKIAPDLTDHQLDDVIQIALGVGIEGIIATNTTISRDNLKESPNTIESIGAGGLSGRPLQVRAGNVLSYIKKRSNDKLILIGVGGIDSPQSAVQRLESGADLIQLYTGFIFQGPGLIKEIKKGLVRTSSK